MLPISVCVPLTASLHHDMQRCYNAVIMCPVCLSSTVCLCAHAILTLYNALKTICIIKMVILYYFEMKELKTASRGLACD